jgi:hypothetical protein
MSIDPSGKTDDAMRMIFYIRGPDTAVQAGVDLRDRGSNQFHHLVDEMYAKIE